VQLIDARAFWVQMEKSLGNKRRRIGDPSDVKTRKDPDNISEITKIFGDFRDGDVRTFSEEDAVTMKSETKATMLFGIGLLGLLALIFKRRQPVGQVQYHHHHHECPPPRRGGVHPGGGGHP
jgi:hypothetical protein